MRTLLPLFLLTASLMLAGCTFARYSKQEVQVIDEQTKEGVPSARLRTFYSKPMLDMTYQRKDRETTDREGFATLTIATNWSQRMFLGWTHGIIPHVAVEAGGYGSREVGLGFGRSNVFVIPIKRAE